MNLIECHGLTKRYGRTNALNGVDLVLQAGPPIALIGPNGAGKTTLLSLLCGFIRPTSGSALILGQAPGSRGLIGKLGALPQDAQFDPNLTVVDQLRYYGRLQGLTSRQATDDAQRVLGLVQLQDRADQPARLLSHGMRKRAALAQALLGTPQLILLDEPTAGVDPPNVKIIRDLIRSLVGETTFIISSHNLDELEKLCGFVVQLTDGSVQHAGRLHDSGGTGYLTLGAPDIPGPQFIEACLQLPDIVAIERQSQGEYLISCKPDSGTDQALLALLHRNGWSYRHLVNGRSLENRLYGSTASAGH